MNASPLDPAPPVPPPLAPPPLVPAPLAPIHKALGFLSTTCIFLSSCAMVTLVVIFGWLVFGRYVLNVTPTWVEQLALLLICYITFLGAAAGVHEDTHLGVSFLREAMPAPIRNFLRLVCDIAVAGFGLVMLLACMELVQFGWSTKLPMLDIPEGMRTLPAALCGGMMLLFAGLRAIMQITYMVKPGTRPAEETPSWD